ncbi:MAG: response regulator, partial [Acidimicrobiia bacterium]|nr:response regulator [Acidimicrobiia bacterium]
MKQGQTEWILALDDDPWAVEIVCAMLESHGYQVQPAHSMEEAIEIIRRLGSPSLLLVDGMMPNVDGFMACRTFRELSALDKVPIVFLTALDGEGDRVAALEAGADDFLTKPVSESMLITRVRTLVELYRRRLQTEVRSRYEAVMDATGDGILILDSYDQVIEANQAALSLLAIPRNPLRTIHLPTYVEQHWVVERGSIGPFSEALLVWRAEGPPT